MLYGAGEGTRTPTPKAPEPKSGASTNSATPAILFSLAKPTQGCERNLSDTAQNF
jgi:hypothetical protein